MLRSLTSSFRFAVFASSLLSLISPWAHSPVARYPLSQRCPRPVVPPQPPRRHSDPTHTNENNNPDQTKKARRYSDIKNPQSKLDLRQELQNLNLNRQEFLGWLGDEFDEMHEFEYDHEEFKHDIHLQRSVSLDRGIDIVNYLHTIGSDWSGSEVGSSWTVHSDEHKTLMFEQYRNFEDIPASPSKVKSRRVSDMDALGRNLALSALRDSYKGVDMGRSGNISPQIKKLQRSFTFPDKLEDFMEAVRSSAENLNEDVRGSSSVDSPCSSKTSEGSRSGLERMRMLHRSLSYRNSADRYRVKQGSDVDGLEIRIPIYRSISMDPNSAEKVTESDKNLRHRRVGMTEIFQGNKREVNLRKEVLIKKKQTDVKSCENLSRLLSRRGSFEGTYLGIPTLVKGSYGVDFINTSDVSAMRKIKITPSVGVKKQLLPTIVVTDHSGSGVANIETPTNSSKVVEISKCDCRICTEDVGVDRTCFTRKIFSKLLLKIVSFKEYGRKLTYCDENNNKNNDEMYKCIIHILKLMFGLWLRHLDHNSD